MRARYTRLRAARLLALTFLVVVLVVMVTSSHPTEEPVGPFATGDGDAVSVAPRAVP